MQKIIKLKDKIENKNIQFKKQQQKKESGKSMQFKSYTPMKLTIYNS
jgi:hypothetical protein